MALTAALPRFVGFELGPREPFGSAGAVPGSLDLGSFPSHVREHSSQSIWGWNLGRFVGNPLITPAQHRSRSFFFQDGAKGTRILHSLSPEPGKRGGISQISLKKGFEVGGSELQIYFSLFSAVLRFAGFAYQGRLFFLPQPGRSGQVWSNQTPLSWKCSGSCSGPAASSSSFPAIFISLQKPGTALRTRLSKPAAGQGWPFAFQGALTPPGITSAPWLGFMAALECKARPRSRQDPWKQLFIEVLNN